jgi:hypothetical protein
MLLHCDVQLHALLLDGFSQIVSHCLPPSCAAPCSSSPAPLLLPPSGAVTANCLPPACPRVLDATPTHERMLPVEAACATLPAG